MTNRFLFILFLFIGINALGQKKPKLTVQHGHESSVKSIVFSPNEEYLISGDKAGVVKVWDVQSGKLLKTSSHFGGDVKKISVHPSKFKYLVQQKNFLRLVGYSGKVYHKLKTKPDRVIVDSDVTTDHVIFCTKERIYVRDQEGDSTIIRLSSQRIKKISNKSSTHIKSIFYKDDGKVFFLNRGELFCWNYHSDSLTKINLELPTGFYPLSLKYTKVTDRLWISNANSIISYDSQFDIESTYHLQEGEEFFSTKILCEIGDTVLFAVKKNKIESMSLIAGFDSKRVGLDVTNQLFNVRNLAYSRKNRLLASQGELTIIQSESKSKPIYLVDEDGKLYHSLESDQSLKNIEDIYFSDSTNHLVINTFGTYINAINLNDGEVFEQSLGVAQTVVNDTEEYLVSVDFNGKYLYVSEIGHSDRFKGFDLTKGCEIKGYVIEVKYLPETETLLLIDAGDKTDESNQVKRVLEVSFDAGIARLEEVLFFEETLESISDLGLILLSSYDENNVKKFEVMDVFDDKSQRLSVPAFGISTFVAQSNEIISVSEDSLAKFHIHPKNVDLMWSRNIKRTTDWISVINAQSNSLIWIGTGDGYLYGFDPANGSAIVKGTRIHKSAISSLNQNKSGTRLFSGGLDGQINVFNLSDNKLTKVASIVPSFSENEQGIQTMKGALIYTPKSYYSSIGAANDLFHFVSDRKHYSFDQFDLVYNRPDKVFESINGANNISNSYYAAYKKRIEHTGIVENSDSISIPELSIVNRKQIPINSRDKLLKLKLKYADKNSSYGEFNVWVNGVPINDYTLEDLGENRFEVEIELNSGDNEIQISSTNKLGFTSLRETVNTFHESIDMGNLYVLSIGVSNFNDSNRNLNYPIKDASDIVRALLKNGQFENVYSKVLKDAEFNMKSLDEIESWLENSNANDAFVLFYSGHGVLDNNKDFYFSTSTIDFKNPAVNGMPFDELMSLYSAAKARKRLVLIDACHSGELDMENVKFVEVEKGGKANSKGDLFKKIVTKKVEDESFDNMKYIFRDIRRESGITIFTSSSGKFESFENSELKNGYFTSAIVDALNGGADFDSSGTIEINELVEFVVDSVKKQTNGDQIPVIRTENVRNNFSVK